MQVILLMDLRLLLDILRGLVVLLVNGGRFNLHQSMSPPLTLLVIQKMRLQAPLTQMMMMTMSLRIGHILVIQKLSLAL